MSPAKRNKKLHRATKVLSKKKSNKDSELENVETDTLRGLLKRKWKVFRVSPLHNFSVNKLRFYEKKLNEGMNSKRKMVVTYKSKLTLNENLRPNKQCAEGIQVEVMKDDSQRVYLGHFISWSSGKEVENSSESLRVLLVDAKEDEMQRVQHSLCKMFDCDIQPVTFSFYALITFFAKLLETPRNNPDASAEHIIIEYQVPECEAKDKIKISLCLEEAKVVLAVVMESLHEKFKDITTIEIIWEFYNKVLNHIYHIYKLDLTLAGLQKIIFPDAFISADGQIKMTSDEAAISTLNILGEFTPLDAVISM